MQGNVSVSVVWKRSLETELRLEDGNRSPKRALGTVQSPQQETDWNDEGIDDSPCGRRDISKRE